MDDLLGLASGRAGSVGTLAVVYLVTGYSVGLGVLPVHW